MFAKTFRVKLRYFHRWLGVIVGLQLLMWVLSGLYFSWLSFDLVKGEDKAKKWETASLRLASLLSPSQLSLPLGSVVTGIQIEASPRGVIYRLGLEGGQRLHFDASSGARLDIMTPAVIGALALEQEQSGKLKRVELIEASLREFKGQIPVYRVELEDGRRTRLYVDPWTGKVLARRNFYWQVYDFLWMLHIMDYKEREDFNNVFIRALSLGACGLIASGYFLFFFGKMPGRKRYRLKDQP